MGELEQSDCDYEEVFQFLTLLSRGRNHEINNNYEEISEIEWNKVVKKAKKKVHHRFSLTGLIVFINAL